MAPTEQNVVRVARDAFGSGRRVPFRVVPEKTAIPDPPVGVLHRRELVERLDPARQRLTVLVAPGGFGKTTLLADCCQRMRARGEQVIWLSVDEEDDAQRVVAHLAYAADLPWGVDGAAKGTFGDPEMHVLDSVLDAIRADGRPWVVAVDELERISDSGTRVVDYLIWRGPANLHVALACRQVPPSVDIATPVAAGRGIVAGVEELRFTLAEFGDFLGGAVSRERLRELWAEAEGWPIAACLQRNMQEHGAGSDDGTGLSHNWVAARLMRGLAARDRRFLLEAGSFEWVDARMFDEVMGPGSAQRLVGMPVLRGLVQGIDGGTAFRLHPLVRHHALEELRALGDGEDLHRRIAKSLARRGRTVTAMRQALEAGDGDLAGEIFDEAGAVRLVLRGGMRSLQDAVALVPEEVMRRRPRLQLAQHAVDMMNVTLPRPIPEGVWSNQAERDESGRELQIDGIILRGVFLMCSCVPIGAREVRATMDASTRLLAERELEPLAAGGFHYGHAVYHHQRGDLAAALTAARRVGGFADACPSAWLSARLVEGATLFARGDVEEAEAVLASAQRTAQRGFAGYESPELICDAFTAEVALETNRVTMAGRRTRALDQLAGVGAWLDVYAAAVEVRVELAFRQGPPTRALKLLEEAWTFAQSRRLESFVRWLAAVRVSALLKAGEVAEAERFWRQQGLPTDPAALADLEGQSWREMEAVCGARVRLLVAAKEHRAALEVARAYAARARERGLARSESWATALAMHAAWLAGDMAAAQEALIEHLRVLQRSGFVRALVEHAEAATAVLQGLDTLLAELKEAEEAALAVIGAVGGDSSDSSEADLSPREMQILTQLPDASNKEIARTVGITENGVRYHLKNIFSKLGVGDRRAAAQQARALGLLDDSPSSAPPPPPGGSPRVTSGGSPPPGSRP